MRPTTTLCVTAGNDAVWIGACLASAQSVVDETVVVTMGSTDRTAEIARRAGAAVIEGRPPGSHAERSNLPIEYAHGDWMLSLRADEVLDDAARSHWPLIGDTGVDGVQFVVRTYAFSPTLKWRRADPRALTSHGAAGWRPREDVRLFRRSSGIRFCGRMDPAVRPAIEAAGGRIARTDAVIHRYSWLRLELTATDRRLADASVTGDGESARDWVDLGVAQLMNDGLSAASASFECAFEATRDPDAAFFLAGLTRDDPDAACRLLAVAIAGNRDDSSPWFDTADALERLALAHERLGHQEAAIACNREAIARRPDSPVALRHLAGLLIEAGSLDEAEQLIEQGVAHDPGLSATWSLRAALDLRRRKIGQARRSLALALECNPIAKSAQRALVEIGPAVRRAPTADRLMSAKSTLQNAEGGAGFSPPLAGPAEAGPSNRSVEPLAPGGMVSVIGVLGGGAGRVAVDIALALAGQRDQVLLTLDDGREWGQRYYVELERASIPIVQLDRRSDMAHAIARLRPAVVVQHSWLEYADDPIRVGGERWVAIGHEGAAMPPGYDAYVNLSDYQAAFQRHLPGELLVRIPNGVDLGRFPETRRSEDGPVTIAVLSRLMPEKFPRRFLECLPDLTAINARVLVVGRGPRRVEIEPEAQAAGLADRVCFLGSLPSADVPGFLLAADIGLHLTETWEEVHSLAILEMLAAGLPIVSQPRGCLPELVRHDVNGLLAEDESSVRAAIERLVRSPDLRLRFGRRSRETARAYDIRTFQVRYCELIERLTAGEAPSLTSA